MKKLIPEIFKRWFRKSRSMWGSFVHNNPEKSLKIIGVTGTSGKSTTSSMIFHVMKESGLKVGIVSTVGARAGDKIVDTGLHVTTPDPIQLKKVLRMMVDEGIEYVVLEASSHALAQGRTGNIKFDFAVYTNIKRDHLDWHKTWENYAKSKAILLKNLRNNGYVIVNRDDEESYDFLVDFAKKTKQDEKVLSYSINELKDNMQSDQNGIKFTLDEVDFEVPVIGGYNIHNALATITLVSSMGIELEAISENFKSYPGIKGRMEVIQKDPFYAIVDFAHNSDSLERALKNAKGLADEKGRLIVIFGSAGLRDVEKRYTMGRVAAELADVVVVTAEDPRTESLYEINSEIIRGAESVGGKLVHRFADSSAYEQYGTPGEIEENSVFAFDQESVESRYNAIDFAVKIAKKGDVVITEGKGHELSLCFGKTEFPFTDHEAITKALNNRFKK